MRSLLVFAALSFAPACLMYRTPVQTGEVTTNQDRFMSREESAREVKSTKHSKHWEKVLAEREKKRKLEVAAAPVPRAQQPVVAVFELDATKAGVDADTADALGDYFGIQLAALAKYRVVPRSDVRELIAQKKADSYRACYDEACHIEVGKALAAQKSLSPRLLRAGDQCVLGAVLYDLASEIAEKAASVRVECGPEALLDGVDSLLTELGGGAPVVAAPKVESEPVHSDPAPARKPLTPAE